MSALSGPFVRFLFAGGVNTGLTYLVYLLLLRQMPYGLAYATAFAAGIVLAYFLSRFFVFARAPRHRGFVWVAAIYAVQYLVSASLVHIWVGWIGGHEALAPMFALLFTVPLTFFSTKWVFSRRL